MSHIEQAQRDGYLTIDRKRNQVTYLPHRKTRSMGNPEEEVQLEAFLELIYEYKYPAEKIKVSDPVKMGSATKEADIMVYKDMACKSPHIVVECKRRSVGKTAFDEAIEQAFSYAAAVGASFVWTTSGRYEAHFEVWARQFKEREQNRLPRIPKHEEKFLGFYRLQTKLFRALGKGWRRIQDNPIFTDTAIFAGIMAISVIALSFLTVHYLTEIMSVIKPIWERGMHFGHFFNAIMALSTLLTLVIGGKFMRSHRLFAISQSNRRLDFILLAVVLFAPAWWMGLSNSDPFWWTWGHYKEIDWRSKIFLWPAFKALPFQMMVVYGLIWGIAKHQSKPSRRRKKGKRKH